MSNTIKCENCGNNIDENMKDNCPVCNKDSINNTNKTEINNNTVLPKSILIYLPKISILKKNAPKPYVNQKINRKTSGILLNYKTSA